MSKRYPSFSYNFENYSAKDIVDFLVKNGYEVKYLNNSFFGAAFMVTNLDIYIRILDYNLILKSNFSPVYKFFGDIIWKSIGDLYSERNRARESGDKVRIVEAEKKYEEYHKESSKLYNQLKRKFQMKQGEVPKGIKDLEWIKSLDKKQWWRIF